MIILKIEFGVYLQSLDQPPLRNKVIVARIQSGFNLASKFVQVLLLLLVYRLFFEACAKIDPFLVEVLKRLLEP